MALNLKPISRDALDLFQSRTEVFIHRRAVTGTGCMTGRNGSDIRVRLASNRSVEATPAVAADFRGWGSRWAGRPPNDRCRPPPPFRPSAVSDSVQSFPVA